MKRLGCYAVSMDPITNGHLWVVEQAATMFDHLLVLVANNPKKQYAFAASLRLEFAREATRHLPNVVCEYLETGLVVRYAAQWGEEKHGQPVRHFVRGLRNPNDFLDEATMAQVNRHLRPDVVTVTFTCPPELAHISSSLVRGLASEQGTKDLLQTYVPECVYRDLWGIGWR
jgi:pantetheine-phosphate adenylyltransferase